MAVQYVLSLAQVFSVSQPINQPLLLVYYILWANGCDQMLR